MDSTSANVDVPNFVNSLTGDVKGLKIAVPKEYLGEGVGEEARNSVLEALKVLEGLGADMGRSFPAAFQICSSSLLSAFFIRSIGKPFPF